MTIKQCYAQIFLPEKGIAAMTTERCVAEFKFILLLCVIDSDLASSVQS